jgi:hypothetical protein
MSRIGKKPIPLPAGVKYTVKGNTVLVEGPKGKVSALIAEGITLRTVGAELHVERDSDKNAAVHGLTRALVFNAVYGVTTGWKRELDIVGIGYRAELKGKRHGGVHPSAILTRLSFHCLPASKSPLTPSMTPPGHLRHRPPKGRPGSGRHAFAAQARPVQEQGRALFR